MEQFNNKSENALLLLQFVNEATTTKNGYEGSFTNLTRTFEFDPADADWFWRACKNNIVIKKTGTYKKPIYKYIYRLEPTIELAKRLLDDCYKIRNESQRNRLTNFSNKKIENSRVQHQIKDSKKISDSIKKNNDVKIKTLKLTLKSILDNFHKGLEWNKGLKEYLIQNSVNKLESENFVKVLISSEILKNTRNRRMPRYIYNSTLSPDTAMIDNLFRKVQLLENKKRDDKVSYNRSRIRNKKVDASIVSEHFETIEKCPTSNVTSSQFKTVEMVDKHISLFNESFDTKAVKVILNERLAMNLVEELAEMYNLRRTEVEISIHSYKGVTIVVNVNCDENFKIMIE